MAKDWKIGIAGEDGLQDTCIRILIEAMEVQTGIVIGRTKGIVIGKAVSSILKS